MALVLRFDENHDYVDSITASQQTKCGPFFCVIYSLTGINPVFIMGIDLLKVEPPILWEDQIKREKDLPSKVKTFLLLGGLENAITNCTGNNNN